jgi:hypothetical protein
MNRVEGIIEPDLLDWVSGDIDEDEFIDFLHTFIEDDILDFLEDPIEDPMEADCATGNIICADEVYFINADEVCLISAD